MTCIHDTRKSKTNVNMVVAILVVEHLVKIAKSGPGVIDRALHGRRHSQLNFHNNNKNKWQTPSLRLRGNQNPDFITRSNLCAHHVCCQKFVTDLEVPSRGVGLLEFVVAIKKEFITRSPHFQNIRNTRWLGEFLCCVQNKLNQRLIG